MTRNKKIKISLDISYPFVTIVIFFIISSISTRVKHLLIQSIQLNCLIKAHWDKRKIKRVHTDEEIKSPEITGLLQDYHIEKDNLSHSCVNLESPANFTAWG